MGLTLEQFGIDRLSPVERIELIDLTWDSLPPDAPFTPPDWHIRILEKRVAEADLNPGAGEPWKEVLARLTEFRIFYSVDLQSKTITTIDVTTKDVILSFGGIATGG